MKTTNGMTIPRTPRYFAQGFFLPREHVEHARHGAVPVASAVPADAPFHPHQGDPQQQERDKIGNHEGPAAVLCGLDRKTQEIAQTDGVACHRQDEADARSPPLLSVCLDAHYGLLRRCEICFV